MQNRNHSTTWVNPKTIYELFPSPINSSLGPQKVKNDPKIKSKSNVRIEENIENESFSTTWVDSQKCPLVMIHKGYSNDSYQRWYEKYNL